VHDRCGGQRCSGGEPARPATDIVLTLRPVDGTSADDLVIADGIDAAGEELGFSLEIELPDMPPGRYVIVGSSAATGGWPSQPFRVADR
jgi:hypothetical protein